MRPPTAACSRPPRIAAAEFLRRGIPIGADTSRGDGYEEFRATKEGDLDIIRVGAERYEIPDAVVLGAEAKPNMPVRAGKRAGSRTRRHAERMNCRRIPGFLLVLGIVLAACSRGPSSAERTVEGDLANRTIRIVFDLPGDDIGDQESREVLQRIKDEIAEKDIADVMTSGFGMGTMEVTLRYRGAGSVDELRSTILRIYPKARYRIEGSN